MLCFVKREWAFVNCTNRCYELNYTTKGKLEKGVELQISCAECMVNRPKVCRTYWRVWDRLSLSREAQRSSYKSCSWRCWRTCNLFQKCFHGIQRLNPNRCMRMGVRKHYGMYRFMQTALIIIRWRLTESTPDRVVDKEQKRKEMSSPWLDNREGKEMEKTQK